MFSDSATSERVQDFFSFKNFLTVLLTLNHSVEREHHTFTTSILSQLLQISQLHAVSPVSRIVQDSVVVGIQRKFLTPCECVSSKACCWDLTYGWQSRWHKHTVCCACRNTTLHPWKRPFGLAVSQPWIMPSPSCLLRLVVVTPSGSSCAVCH